MAEQDESSMIGYDPLAWMHEAEDVELPCRSAPDTPPPLTDDLTVIVASNPHLNEAGDSQSVDAITQCQIILEPVQTIQTVAQLHQQLQRMLDDYNKIDIDASAVIQIDTASMQLLLVLKLTAVKLQKEVSIDFPSEKFMEAANLLGLSEMLSVDQAASGFF
ncbi:MAG: STAS domain-containing protein [Methylomonas sp.]|jgi:ABC-type transporter Mla MlaB component|uniref:STAS domain-containing protein n=1 Tax=Methylomonas sp. TaxID=418 RepID=UPI0025F62942|nr:STAS domain-containing protein [Methylomonas sp.]MCK9604940.1 STAS domain-containing protein [Methylomonas sp.]